MDVNNTRFHLLFGQRDWAPLVGPDLTGSNLVWDAERSGISLQPQLFRFRTSPRDTQPEPSHRQGAARDQYGNWYWLSADQTEILVGWRGCAAAEHYWSAADLTGCAESTGDFSPVTPAPPLELTLRGLAVTEHHYLVVGVLEPAGVLVFDLHAGGPPLQLMWPEAVGFAPFDMAPAPGGGVWILDAGEPPRYWALDRYFNTLEMAAPRLDLIRPVAVEGLPDGTVLILDAGPESGVSSVHRYRSGHHLDGFDLAIPADSFDGGAEGETVKLRAHDIACLPGALYAAAADGNQVFAFTLEAGRPPELRMRYLPMRSFTGKALVAAGGEVHYDRKTRWVPVVEQHRPRYEESGSLTTGLLDGKEPDCVWHRVFLDACIPQGAQVVVESRAHNDRELLADAPWGVEPSPYLRGGGAELPYYRPFGPGGPGEGVGTWETLLQGARGRYIQLRLTLSGNRQGTPLIQALRVYYPRFSYLVEYLPDVYQRDRTSASFLERYLANPEGLFTSLEDRIAQAQMLLDVRTAPAEYLEWLAGWFGVSLDAAWDEQRRRLFIRHALELFNQRGTIPGLVRAIRLATDPCPDDALFAQEVTGTGPVRVIGQVRIIEEFLLRRAPGVVFGLDQAEGTGVTTPATAWGPSQGAGPLHARYRGYLSEHFRTISELNEAWGTLYSGWEQVRFPPVRPDGSPEGKVWEEFLQSGSLGFMYTPVSCIDARIYREFLLRRYRRIGPLNLAYRRKWTSFSEVELPSELPSSGVQLVDWFQFVTIYLPAVGSAHRFTVLVPTRRQGRTAGPDPKVVERVVELEKPAHTRFKVEEYWAMFRVGFARLGLDTLVDEGARLAPVVLGQAELGGGHLAYVHPWDAAGRTVVGRDRLRASSAAKIDLLAKETGP